MSKEKKHKLTTASGRPYVENENTMSVGPRGPLLLQDYILHEKMAHFNRERIPERVVHAKGSGAFGTFTVTHDITKYTKAAVFNKIGKQTKVLLRFSTVGGEKGSADTERDPRGFALKFILKKAIGIWLEIIHLYSLLRTRKNLVILFIHKKENQERIVKAQP